MDHFPMGDLIRDGAPLENKTLAGSQIDRELMIKNGRVG
jgi:hypothetical protein